jgi:hypothetical protein
MNSIWISSTAHLFLDGAANDFALMLFARLELVADFQAFVIVNQSNFLFSHELLPQRVRVVNLVARNTLLGLSARALYLYRGHAEHAVSVVACLGTLMPSTGQKAFTLVIAARNGFCAQLAWPPNQRFDSSMAARAVLITCRVPLARPTLPWVAYFCAVVEPAIELLVAYFLAGHFC